MGTVLVGYDAKPAAERALDRAITEARDRGVPLVVVAVEEMPLDPEGPQNFGTLDDSPARMIPLVTPPDLEPVLAEARARIDAAGIEADYLWAAGDPVSTIVDAARDRGAEVVVLGHHHHSLLGRVFGADVAAEVERKVGAPVIVVS